MRISPIYSKQEITRRSMSTSVNLPPGKARDRQQSSFPISLRLLSEFDAAPGRVRNRFLNARIPPIGKHRAESSALSKTPVKVA